MLTYKILSFFICLTATLAAQNNEWICLTEEEMPIESDDLGTPKSINDLKIIRVNYHYMLRTDNTGNFTETDDNMGNPLSGYLHAMTVTKEMNNRASYNVQMNIPPGNNTPVIPKNYLYVVDAVYFWRDNTTSGSSLYSPYGRDKDNVFNTFYTHTGSSAFASNIDPNSKVKYTVNNSIWQGYYNNLTAGNPIDWHWHPLQFYTNHENLHLMGLLHTVRANNGSECGTGCVCPSLGASIPCNSSVYWPINTSCDDGCADTPAAWEITNMNGCTKHPACGWNNASQPYCSNNGIDYEAGNALSPCQIAKIHTNLEGGLNTYLACSAVAVDATFNDLGYPRVTYFGKKVTVGNPSGNLADISSNEKLAIYFSEEVELHNFEIIDGAEFEIVHHGICNF